MDEDLNLDNSQHMGEQEDQDDGEPDGEGGFRNTELEDNPHYGRIEDVIRQEYMDELAELQEKVARLQL